MNQTSPAPDPSLPPVPAEPTGTVEEAPVSARDSFLTSWECLVGVVLALAFGFFFFRGYFSEIYGIENRFLDRQFVLRGGLPVQDDVVLLTISDKCIGEIGSWPWPRSAYARILSLLRQAGAKVVAFDVMFSEPSTYGEEDDQAFAAAVKESGNVVFPVTFDLKTVLNEDFEMERRVVAGHSLPALVAGAVGEGFISIEHKDFNVDGVIRRLYLDRDFEKKPFYILGLECVSRFLNEPVQTGPDRLRIGSLEIPLFTRFELTHPDQPVSSFLLNYLGPTGHFTEVFFSDLYKGPQCVENFQSVFKNKIVIIGSRAQGAAEDTKFSPFGAIAGMEIHANLIQNILSRKFLIRMAPFQSLVLITFLALLLSWLMWRVKGAWIANAIGLVVWGGYIGLAVLLFRRNVVIELAPVFFMLPIQSAVLNLLRQFFDLKQRNRELAKRVRELSIVNEVSQAVNFMGNLNKTLDTILSRAVQALGAERGSVLLLDERYENLVEESVVYGVEGPVQFDPEKKSRFRTGEGVAGEVFTSGATRLIHDVARQTEFKTFADAKGNVRSMICVPLQVRDTPIGVMNIVNKTEGRFDHEDLQLALTMANQAAVVIEKARLFNLATIDGLTGLIVHRHFQAKMEEEFRRAKRYDKPLSFIMTDIDHFKKFNDTWGHQTGDMVLREVAKCVRSSIRDTDVAARYGGEEFAIILPETDSEGAVLFAERLRQKVENAVFKGPKGDLQVAISLGVSAFPLNPMETTQEMIKLADEALYCAKHGGRNQVRLSEVTVPPPAEPA